MHNLWRAKLLYDLNYGQPNFRSRDSKKVQDIISEAGKGSYAALGVELKMKYVNVQRLISPLFMLNPSHLLQGSLSKISGSTKKCNFVHLVLHRYRHKKQTCSYFILPDILPFLTINLCATTFISPLFNPFSECMFEAAPQSITQVGNIFSLPILYSD